jgi:hypothetical protein
MEQPRRSTQAMTSVQRILSGLSDQRFFGTVELRFEAGHIVLLRKTETLKPTEEDCRDNRGPADDR